MTQQRLGVMLSGSGTTLQNFIDRIDDGRLRGWNIAVVISSLSKAYGLVRAEQAGIPTRIVRRKDHADVETFSAAIVEQLDAFEVDLVVEAGWMCMWHLPERYLNRVMNVHPALLPSFGGKGFYGHHVYEAVLAHGCKVTGATVHFVNNEYDAGPIILQRAVDVREDDTPDTLAERVMGAEREIYPQAIELFGQGRLRVEGRCVRILSESEG
ncbi:MAG: phosphoribosylglycinamide formyltransferase [Phycisphaerae bacterium]|nr:phosphoribosylglycinamide formyltransferase [Phycisphaerae bacterium]